MSFLHVMLVIMTIVGILEVKDLVMVTHYVNGMNIGQDVGQLQIGMNIPHLNQHLMNMK